MFFFETERYKYAVTAASNACSDFAFMTRRKERSVFSVCCMVWNKTLHPPKLRRKTAAAPLRGWETVHPASAVTPQEISKSPAVSACPKALLPNRRVGNEDSNGNSPDSCSKQSRTEKKRTKPQTPSVLCTAADTDAVSACGRPVSFGEAGGIVPTNVRFRKGSAQSKAEIKWMIQSAKPAAVLSRSIPPTTPRKKPGPQLLHNASIRSASDLEHCPC